MKKRQAALVCLALIIANAAYAERVFNLTGTIKAKATGPPITENVSGTLTLFDDRTYLLNLEGEISSGIWLEEGTGIQLFQESPTISELIQELELEVSEAAGREIRVTSIVQKEKIKRPRTGNITLTAKVIFVFRPGPTARRPVKVTQTLKAIGLLR